MELSDRKQRYVSFFKLSRPNSARQFCLTHVPLSLKLMFLSLIFCIWSRSLLNVSLDMLLLRFLLRSQIICLFCIFLVLSFLVGIMIDIWESSLFDTCTAAHDGNVNFVYDVFMRVSQNRLNYWYTHIWAACGLGTSAHPVACPSETLPGLLQWNTDWNINPFSLFSQAMRSCATQALPACDSSVHASCSSITIS